MIRRAAAVVLALTLNPALVSAQDTVFTVTVPSADVYKGPTTVTPVIGRAPRGTVLPVSRNLGSWAKVAWPDAPDGVGYVHLTMGRLASSKGAGPMVTAPARTSTAPYVAPTQPAPATRAVPRDQIAVTDEATGTPISHIFGVGGRLESTRRLGATARVWRNDRLGIQFSFMRDAITSSTGAGRVTSMQLEPGAVFALFDHVSDYVWFRPYVGSGLSFHRQSLKVSSPDLTLASDNGFGFRVFAGSEVTFATVQRFGLSVEVGYRRMPTPFAGFEADRLNASLAGHWYIK
jgi:outer membrane protein W